MRKIVMLGILALIAVVTMPTAVATFVYYLAPDSSSVPEGYCQTTEVQLRINASYSIQGGKITQLYEPSCGNITGFTFDPEWESHTGPVFTGGGCIVTFYNEPSGIPVDLPKGDYLIGTYTIHCNATTYCETDLTFKPGMTNTNLFNLSAGDMPFTTDNGTFTCGEPSEESFSKDLYEGWNLVSLPLTPSDNSTNSVLASVSENVSDVYSYNATSKLFESTSTMDTGVGYFVHITQNCTWTYSGTAAYTEMNTELKQGLNMIGWLNCTKQITDLTTIDGKHWYAARWNALDQEFETYNPVAPNGFNDFTAMERGTGYFVSAKEVTTLSESC